MSDKIELTTGQTIRDWAGKNGFDIVANSDPDSPRFFQARLVPTPGPMQLFEIQHTFFKGEAQPLVTVKRVVRAPSAEDALYQYFREPKERSGGNLEYRVGFTIHLKPGTTDNEAIVVNKQPG